MFYFSLFPKLIKSNYRRTLSSVRGLVFIITLIFLTQIFANIVAVEKVNVIIQEVSSNNPDIIISSTGVPYLWANDINYWLISYHNIRTSSLNVKDCFVAVVPLSFSNISLNLVNLCFISDSIFTLLNITSRNEALISPNLVRDLNIINESYTFYSVKIIYEDYYLIPDRNFTIPLKSSNAFINLLAYLTSFKSSIFEGPCIFLPFEALQGNYSYFQQYLYEIAYFAFLYDEKATIFEKIQSFVDKKAKKTEDVLTKFEELFRYTSRAEVTTPVLDALKEFIDGEYKNMLKNVFFLLTPIFLLLILYQFQVIELLKVSWYKDVVIQKMRGASYFQQFFNILLLYGVVDLIAVGGLTLILLVAAIIFRNLIAWLGTYLILAMITLLLSITIQGLGIFRILSAVYKSNIVISEEHGNIISAIFSAPTKWKGTTKKNMFIVFIMIVLLMEAITELISYYLLLQGIDSIDVFLLMFFPRVGNFIFFFVIIIAYLWQNLIFQVVSFVGKHIEKLITEALFFKKYFLRFMKRNRFFIFFTILLVTSLFTFLSYGDQSSKLLQTKRACMYPYDIQLLLPSDLEIENKSLVYTIPGIDKITSMYVTSPMVYYGEGKIKLIIVDGKNFTSYLPKFWFSYMAEGDKRTLETFGSQINSCIVSYNAKYEIGQMFHFGIKKNSNIEYYKVQIIGKATKFFPGLIGLFPNYDNKGYSWVLINYNLIMNETLFREKMNIVFIKLKDKSNVGNFIDKLVALMGISREYIITQPTLAAGDAEPFFALDPYSKLNLGLNTNLMTIFLYFSYVVFLIAGILMLMDGNKLQVDITISQLYSRGIDKKRLERAYILVLWTFFIALEIIGFIFGIIMGFAISAIVEYIEYPFFVPWPSLSIHTWSTFLIMIAFSIIVPLFTLKKDALVRWSADIKSNISKKLGRH